MFNPLQVKVTKSTLSSTKSLFTNDYLNNSDEILAIQKKLQYPHRLSLYQHPPPVEISLSEFEQFALDRLQVLKCIESNVLRSCPEDILKSAVQEVFKKYMPWSPTISVKQKTNVDLERRKDYISHYILRLAYCKRLSEDLRQWFVRYETMLFKLKWDWSTDLERQLFLQSLDLNLEAISPSEKGSLAVMLKQGTPMLDKLRIDFDRENFYKISFESVPDLVARREVFLMSGWAYVPQSALISVIIAEYKKLLLSSLETLVRALPTMDDDDRLKPLLNNISRLYVGKDFTKNNGSLAGKITHEDIDKYELSQYFPPCMQHLNDELKKNAHLKHMGRMQFGLFLKGLGLSMDEALIFWRRAFSKMSDDQFQKGYAYNIRHNYGQEGKRANYTPYSCVKIITSNAPSHGDNHGCPFKHFSKDNLHKMLLKHGLDQIGCKEVGDLAQAGHYQVACTKYLEITKGKCNPHAEIDATNQHNVIDTIQHPNEFTELSMRLSGMVKEGERKHVTVEMEVDSSK